MKKLAWLGIALALAAALIWLYRQYSRLATPLPPAPRTVEAVIKTLAPVIEPIWKKRLARAGLAYPPSSLVLIAWKKEKLLEVFVQDSSGRTRLVHTFPILAASGEAGPKLREGDLQVPEGFYRIELFNPNSRFHLSLRVNYPSPEDIRQAEEEGRDTAMLGSDIMIHGNAVSTGCLAIGDPAIEELFFLAARAGVDHIQLLIAPQEFTGTVPDQPAWMLERYERLRTAIGEVRRAAQN